MNSPQSAVRRIRSWVWVLLLAAGMYTPAVAQRVKTVDLKLESVPLEQLFEELGRQTGVKFLYNAELVQGKKRVSASGRNVPFTQVLDRILPSVGLDYALVGNQVVIRRSEKIQAEAPKPQTFEVKGRVLDAKGAHMPGATVIIDAGGKTLGTTADTQGCFIIASPVESGLLKVSFVGYKSKSQKFQAGTEVEARLEEDTAIDEVTVIGYGVRKKRQVVGAISTVKAEDLQDVPAPSLDIMLQGRVAGLGVMQQSGSPGSGSTSMTIRGYNSLLDDEAGYKSSGAPLYVIDGVPVHSFTSPVTGTNTIAEIDPSTIESVEVCKDAASAAIYGSRAANGVILITTKKGREGRATFSANVSYSVAELPVAPDQLGGRMERMHYMRMAMATSGAYYDKSSGTYKYPTSYEEAALNGVNFDLFWNRGQGMEALPLVQDSLNAFYNNSTNWYKYMFRKGKVINANIQASGGNATMNYLVGGGVYKETGIMPGSDFLRGNVIVNLSVKPVKNLTLDNRTYLAYTDRSRGQGGGAGGAFESLTVDPRYQSSLYSGGGSVEKKVLQILNGQSEENTSYRLRESMVLSWQIIPGLTVSTSASMDFNQVNQNFFRPSYLDPTYRESKSTGTVERDILLSNENLINYNFSAGSYNFDLLAGLSFDANKIWTIGGYGLGGPSDNVYYVSSAFPDMIYDPVSDYYRATMRYQSNFTETAMTSYFGRIAYNYDEKYLLEATLRRDGSSVFGPEVRWATFPSVAVGWAFSEEKFMKWAWWLDFSKVRASWGQTGSQFGIPYLAQGLMEPGYKFDGVQGMRPSGVVNRKLRWEQADQYDVGLDLDMFNHRFSLSVDWYHKYTKSLIYRVPMPGDMYGEANVQWRNAMAVSNDGLEIEAKVDIIRKENLSWRTRLNIARNWNCFRESYSGMDIAAGMVIGKPLSGIWLYKDEGFIQNEADVPFYYDEEGKKHLLSPDGDDAYSFKPGMRKIADLNGDGQINEDDRYYAGSALPTIYGGWAHELRWKNFDLTFFLTFTLGRNMVNTFRYKTAQGEDHTSRPIFSQVSPDDFWQQAGDNPMFPAYGFYPNAAIQYTGMFSSNLEKVHYCKLKQLTLGYTLPQRIARKVGLSGLRVFVTGENLFTLSNYSGLDPEVVSVYTGIDNGAAYPLSRKWTIGLTINL